MEEEIEYSTVVFRDVRAAPKERKEDPTIYSEVKPSGSASTVPTDGEAAACSHSHLLAVCLGILCFLLVASISAIVYLSVLMTKQKSNLSVLTAENEQLITERNLRERETEQLSRVTDNLNWTLSIILRLDTFRVHDYCPDKECQPCLKDWIQFKEKCYLFYNKKSPWMTARESHTHCRNKAADLVVIDSLHEQEFISNHTKHYYDRFHGYWLGLNKMNNKDWGWIDGRNDTLGYWIGESFEDVGQCALMIPGRNVTASWDPADCGMKNKFICESDVLVKV
ncbi:C-type lectin domain family 4 member G isoform X1 [Gymnodraco acuticeps]|uniref:C-type lectin domain family 4 member G isoform X1 n=1 Tax=Gymnodraco acuticeps TaxID=8218 RepID=A0A6P8U830_GYMAC|nr:C-type lectin domain family 4 member G isoform X1 [Gymnodraco acuticeps]